MPQVTSTSNGWTFSYDDNGNMKSGRGATISWTSFNYPASITNGALFSSFSYTPERQYWKQDSNYIDGAATTIYVAGLLEKVTTINGTDYRHMIRAGGATIIVSRQTGGTNSVRYLTSDHLGSNAAITNASGGVLANLSFDAFGKRRGSNWSGPPSAGDWAVIASTTRHGFTDHSMLDHLGLIHMNGRVQDPLLGRFLSADPFITDPTNTQSYNRYSYVLNNPLSLVDPSGFSVASTSGLVEPCTLALYCPITIDSVFARGLIPCMTYECIYLNAQIGTGDTLANAATARAAEMARSAANWLKNVGTEAWSGIQSAGKVMYPYTAALGERGEPGSTADYWRGAGKAGLETGDSLARLIIPQYALFMPEFDLAPTDKELKGASHFEIATTVLGVVASEARLASTTERLAARGVLATPKVSSSKLQNIINDLYKGTTNPGRVGTGTTADAVRHELATGEAVGGTFHSQKATEYARGLENWLRGNPNAPFHDRLVAQSVLDDLRSALGGGP